MRSGRLILLSDPMRNSGMDTGVRRSNKKLRNRSGCSNIQWQSSGIDQGTRRAMPSARNWIGSTREWIYVDRVDCWSTTWIGPTYIFLINLQILKLWYSNFNENKLIYVGFYQNVIDFQPLCSLFAKIREIIGIFSNKINFKTMSIRPEIILFFFCLKFECLNLSIRIKIH